MGSIELLIGHSNKQHARTKKQSLYRMKEEASGDGTPSQNHRRLWEYHRNFCRIRRAVHDIEEND